MGKYLLFDNLEMMLFNNYINLILELTLIIYV